MRGGESHLLCDKWGYPSAGEDEEVRRCHLLMPRLEKPRSFSERCVRRDVVSCSRTLDQVLELFPHPGALSTVERKCQKKWMHSDRKWVANVQKSRRAQRMWDSLVAHGPKVTTVLCWHDWRSLQTMRNEMEKCYFFPHDDGEHRLSKYRRWEWKLDIHRRPARGTHWWQRGRWKWRRSRRPRLYIFMQNFPKADTKPEVWPFRFVTSCYQIPCLGPKKKKKKSKNFVRCPTPRFPLTVPQKKNCLFSPLREKVELECVH